jgi:hypothetical protein
VGDIYLDNTQYAQPVIQQGASSAAVQPAPVQIARDLVARKSQLISRFKPAFSSSQEGPAYSASAAVDGKGRTRWASTWSDPQWLYVDLGAPYQITKVVLNWEAAYGSSYQIQVSDNARQWNSIYVNTAGQGKIESLLLAGGGRYVRLLIDKRATPYGNSLYEFEVFGYADAPMNDGSGKTNLALKQPASASSDEGDVWSAQRAVDGDTNTRWSSSFSDPQWISVDLGNVQPIHRVLLRWEGAFARAYQLQVSDDKANWKTVYATKNGDGNVDDIPVTATGRYVRMLGTQRDTEYGYSLWDFEVY